jgi:hypothetical protein
MRLPAAVALREGKSITAAELATETKGSRVLIGKRKLVPSLNEVHLIHNAA